MYFPLIERRIFNGNRRIKTSKKRQRQRADAEQKDKNSNLDRREVKDRRVLKLDRETLLYAKLLINDKEPDQTGKENPPEKSKTLSFCSLILVPLAIAGSSIYMTGSINEHQTANAEIIAERQLYSAELIAKGQRENATKIADAQMQTQHLEHLVEIFSGIISSEQNSPLVKHQLIQSLAVYGNEALPFLLQIQQYSSTGNVYEAYKTNNVVSETIKKIVEDSQLDLSHRKVEGKKSARINLRNKVYSKYKMNDSKFSFVNLFRANFSGSSLQDSRFENVDLFETDFQHSNLRNVKFIKANVRKTDFRHALIEGVEFKDCLYLEDAIFTLNTLLLLEEDHDKLKKDPVYLMKNKKYTLLLMNSEKILEKIAKEEKGKLNKVYKKLNISNFEQLQDIFKALKQEKDDSVDDQQETQQVSISSTFDQWIESGALSNFNSRMII